MGTPFGRSSPLTLVRLRLVKLCEKIIYVVFSIIEIVVIVVWQNSVLLIIIIIATIIPQRRRKVKENGRKFAFP